MLQSKCRKIFSPFLAGIEPFTLHAAASWEALLHTAASLVDAPGEACVLPVHHNPIRATQNEGVPQGLDQQPITRVVQGPRVQRYHLTPAHNSIGHKHTPPRPWDIATASTNNISPFRKQELSAPLGSLVFTTVTECLAVQCTRLHSMQPIGKVDWACTTLEWLLATISLAMAACTYITHKQLQSTTALSWIWIIQNAKLTLRSQRPSAAEWVAAHTNWQHFLLVSSWQLLHVYLRPCAYKLNS